VSRPRRGGTASWDCALLVVVEFGWEKVFSDDEELAWWFDAAAMARRGCGWRRRRDLFGDRRGRQRGRVASFFGARGPPSLTANAGGPNEASLCQEAFSGRAEAAPAAVGERGVGSGK
jgi:hypothetical protein